jgi:hypothetical protein
MLFKPVGLFYLKQNSFKLSFSLNINKKRCKLDNKESDMSIPRKKSVLILILISIVTFGIYPAFWYFKHSPEFDNLMTNTKSKKGFAIFYIFLAVLSILNFVFLNFLVSQQSGSMPVSNFSEIPLYLVLSFVTLIFIFILIFVASLILAFNYRKILNEALINKGSNVKLSGFYTFLFNFLYLQYEINRIVDDKENNKRLAPLIFLIFLLLFIVGFVLLLLLIVLGIAFSPPLPA